MKDHSSVKKYNTTQLNVAETFERHIYHRDYFAHYLRWTHVLKCARSAMKILDVGCGSGNLYEVFYRNRFQPKRYLGLDIRKKTIELNRVRFPKAEFEVQDLCRPYDYTDKWDMIVSFEVIEHIGKQNGEIFLDNIVRHAHGKTIILLSTPCFDPQVGAADNHMIEGEVGEFTYPELKELLQKFFVIDRVYGTFASIKDYKPKMSKAHQEMFTQLSTYYDSNIMSVIFAPLYPECSRNCIWRMHIPT